MFDLRKTKIPGVFELFPHIHHDNRGKFVKVFQREEFESWNLNSEFLEEFYSVSLKGVIRGLHFQIPPFEHTKLVYCVSGQVQDVVVDLRKGSPTYGRFEEFELSSKLANMIYIPKGVAHGFCVLSQEATMIYKTSTDYSSLHDSGILWNSMDIKWLETNPIVSHRDQKLIPFSEFKSPFDYSSVEYR